MIACQAQTFNVACTKVKGPGIRSQVTHSIHIKAGGWIINEHGQQKVHQSLECHRLQLVKGEGKPTNVMKYDHCRLQKSI